MKTSAGILITDSKKLLMAHVTLQVQYDIPKGLIEPGETPLNCALRELSEETGLMWTDADTSMFVDLGVFDYLPTKQLHLFLYEWHTLPDTSLMKCSSMFERYGKQYPEVDRYMYVPLNELANYASSKLYPVLVKALVKYL